MEHPTGPGVIQRSPHQRADRWHPAVLTPSTAPPARPKLLDQVRQAIRTRHYSRRTEDAYVGWIKRYIFFHFFHGKRYPAEIGEQGVTRRLSSLAVDFRVIALSFLFVITSCDQQKQSDSKQPVVIEKQPIGRFQIVNGTPQMTRNIMLLDTVSGDSWITCVDKSGATLWCKIEVSESTGVSK